MRGCKSSLLHACPSTHRTSSVRRAVDSLKDIRTITDGMDILPAKQCGMSYALQHLSAGRESTQEPLLSWQTYLSSDKAAELLGYCCEPVRKMRIGGDIRAFCPQG